MILLIHLGMTPPFCHSERKRRILGRNGKGTLCLPPFPLDSVIVSGGLPPGCIGRRGLLYWYQGHLWVSPWRNRDLHKRLFCIINNVLYELKCKKVPYGPIVPIILNVWQGLPILVSKSYINSLSSC